MRAAGRTRDGKPERVRSPKTITGVWGLGRPCGRDHPLALRVWVECFLRDRTDSGSA